MPHMLADQNVALPEQLIIRALQRSSEDGKTPGFCALLLQAIQGLVNMSLPDIKLMAIIHGLPEDTKVMLIDVPSGDRLLSGIPHGLKTEGALLRVASDHNRAKCFIQRKIKDPLNLF